MPQSATSTTTLPHPGPRGQILKDLLLLAIVFGCLYLALTHFRPLGNPDEGRYAEIPREMLASGDWVNPRLNGLLYFEKPPLLYWLTAASIRVLGFNEHALRLWPALFGLIGILMTYGTARRLYGRTAGLFSAIVLGTCLLWFGISQMLILDGAVSTCMTAALFCFLLAFREPPGKRRFWLLMGFYLAMALATLTKGLIGFLIPGAILFLWILLLKQWKQLRNVHLLVGVLVFLAVAVPWHVLAALGNPSTEASAGLLSDKRDGQGFFWFYFVHEHFLRYFTSSANRGEPFWFFLVIAPLGFFPWVAFLPQAIRHEVRNGWRGFREHPEVLLFLIWVVFVIAFFSISQSKLVPYILPIYPALAILTGRYLADAWNRPAKISLRGGLISYGVIAILLGLACPIGIYSRGDKVAEGGLALACAIGGTFLVSGLYCLWKGRARVSRTLLVVPILSSLVFLVLFNPIAPLVMRPGTKAFAEYLKPRLQPGDRVFILRGYFQDFPPYLGRMVSVAASTPNEQEFGLAREDHSDRYLEGDAFVRLWNSPETVYALVRHKRLRQFQQKFPEFRGRKLMIDRSFLLLTNQPVKRDEAPSP